MSEGEEQDYGDDEEGNGGPRPRNLIHPPTTIGMNPRTAVKCRDNREERKRL